MLAETALALILLIAAGLFMRGALQAADTDPGFDLDGGLLAEVDTSLAGMRPDQGRQLYLDLLNRLRALPGAESASLSGMVPFGTTRLAARRWSSRRACRPHRTCRPCCPRPGWSSGRQGAAAISTIVIGLVCLDAQPSAWLERGGLKVGDDLDILSRVSFGEAIECLLYFVVTWQSPLLIALV